MPTKKRRSFINLTSESLFEKKHVNNTDGLTGINEGQLSCEINDYAQELAG